MNKSRLIPNSDDNRNTKKKNKLEGKVFSTILEEPQYCLFLNWILFEKKFCSKK